MKTEVTDEAHRIIQKYAALDVEYDRETKHGITQGTYLPGESFGAIAYDDDNRAYGWEYGAESAADADQKALAECSERAGDCKVVVRFSKGCAALAVGSGTEFGTTLADSRDEAEAAALFACKRATDACVIAASSCAQP